MPIFRDRRGVRVIGRGGGYDLRDHTRDSSCDCDSRSEYVRRVMQAWLRALTLNVVTLVGLRTSKAV